MADLRERSRIDLASHCWHWTGALDRQGVPRIWTLDYERIEKRVMTGPRAVWNIAHNEAPAPWAYIFRSCGCADCVNPAHMRLAHSRAEWGMYLRHSGRRKGKGRGSESVRQAAYRGLASQGQNLTSIDVVRAVKAAPLTINNCQLGRRLGVSHHVVGNIRRGKSYAWVHVDSAAQQGGLDG